MIMEKMKIMNNGVCRYCGSNELGERRYLESGSWLYYNKCYSCGKTTSIN